MKAGICSTDEYDSKENQQNIEIYTVGGRVAQKKKWKNGLSTLSYLKVLQEYCVSMKAKSYKANAFKYEWEDERQCFDFIHCLNPDCISEAQLEFSRQRLNQQQS